MLAVDNEKTKGGAAKATTKLDDETAVRCKSGGRKFALALRPDRVMEQKGRETAGRALK